MAFLNSCTNSKKIKVLHLVEASLAGVRRHVIELTGGLCQDYQDEIEFHLGYSLRRADSSFMEGKKFLESVGVRCFECDMTRSISPALDLKSLREVVIYIRENNIDIIHTHSAKAGYIGRSAAKISGRTKSIYTPHSSPFRLSPKYHILEGLAGWMLSDAIIAVSQSEKEELVSNKICPENKVHVIGGGIPDSLYMPGSLQTTLNTKSEGFIIGTMGRLVPQKAPTRFVEIAEQTLKKFPEVQFQWIGDGEMRQEIDKIISSKGLTGKVQITGWLQDAEKALLELDVFLLASNYESLGYTTIEAMRAGLPCVVSNVTGSKDVVEAGETGFIVSPDAIDDYVKSIGHLLSDAQLREKMGKAGYVRWKEKFHLSSMVRNTARLYQDLLSTYPDKNKVMNLIPKSVEPGSENLYHSCREPGTSTLE